MTNDRILIIGGGIIGTACAHFLTERGYRVAIIEKNSFGSGASHGNCGLICPSHVLPLSEPPALRAGMLALFARNAPFKIHPRWDWNLWSWLWNFARRCNRRDMLAAGKGIQRLLASSMELYTDLAERQGLACEWQKQGLLFVYRNRRPFEEYSLTNQLLTEHFREPAQRIDGDAVLEWEPALLPGLAGGWYYKHDAHLRPDVLLSSWRQRLENCGVTIRERCEFQQFVWRNGRRIGAQIPGEMLEADHFVIASGAWTPQLAQGLGIRIPIEPGKGYSITMARPAVCPVIPLMLPEYRVAVTPMQTGYRLGSIMEFAGFDSSLRPERLALLKSGAQQFLREPLGEPVLEEWTGFRPMTYDSLPVIDRLPRSDNVFLAVGHNMLGLSMALATGRLIAELIAGEPPHLDPSPYAATRFKAGLKLW